MSTRLAIFALIAALFALVSAQSTTSLADPHPAPTGAVEGAGSKGFTFAGCYNETTGYSNGNNVRALVGNMTASNNMTTANCMDFCSKISGIRYAGLEYGRECWCAPYLNAQSTELNATACSYGCSGNTSELCGGPLALSLYNLTDKSASSAAGLTGKEGALMYCIGAAVLTLGFVFGL